MVEHNEEKLYQELVALREFVSRPDVRPGYGICGAVRHVTDPRTMRVRFAAWPGFSGDVVYPVTSSSTALPAELEYYEALHFRTLWDEHTEYGKARRDLLDYLIKFSRGLLYGGGV